MAVLSLRNPTEMCADHRSICTLAHGNRGELSSSKQRQTVDCPVEWVQTES